MSTARIAKILRGSCKILLERRTYYDASQARFNFESSTVVCMHSSIILHRTCKKKFSTKEYFFFLFSFFLFFLLLFPLSIVMFFIRTDTNTIVKRVSNKCKNLLLLFVKLHNSLQTDGTT